MKEETFYVQGMHCVSCASLIKKKLEKLPGISQCEVNYGTETATVSYDHMEANLSSMNAQVKKLGYSLHSSQIEDTLHTDEGHDIAPATSDTLSKERRQMELIRLRRKTEFVVPIALFVFISMTWQMLLHLFRFIPAFPLTMMTFDRIAFILATPVLFWIGKPFIEAVIRFGKYRVANMDSLVGIGTLTAYVYSSILLFSPEIQKLLNAPEGLYFDVTIVVIGFITLGKYLEARTKLKTGEAIEKLLHLQAKTATVIRNEKEIEIPISEVIHGDIIRVKPGGRIPVDGQIIDGKSSVDESMITGESIPVDKNIQDHVIGATINKQGFLIVRATKIGKEMMLSRIISMVEKAQGTKAPIERIADNVSSIFVPIVLVLACLVFVIWALSGSFSIGLISFIGVLVIACPCAMGLATPTAIIVGVGKAAENGILIKDAESLETLSNVNFILFDKTGTLTKGKPEVTDIRILSTNSKKESSMSDSKFLQILATLEKDSEHPLSYAIMDKARKEKITPSSVTNFKAIEGKGVEGIIGKELYWAGNISMAQEYGADLDLNTLDTLSREGKTAVIVGKSKIVLGIIGIADTVRDDARETVQKLHNMGLTVAMLTGDRKEAARYIGQQLGIDRIIAEVLPNDKGNQVKKLQVNGNVVAMVGDGINDAPALATADVGIAMGTGTDIAIESAGITLLGGQIHQLSKAILLSRATMKIVKQNLFWAFFYNIISIPVAAGLLYPFFGILLSPAIAGAAMAFSSVSVITNSLRLKKTSLNMV